MCSSSSFSVSPYSAAQLSQTAHCDELRPENRLWLHLDYKMSGVGSASCGPALDEEWKLNENIFDWRFALAILAGAGGLFALTAGGIALLIHLSGLTSLGVSYLTPFSDARAARAILRPRLIRQKWREAALRPQDLRNQGDGT